MNLNKISAKRVNAEKKHKETSWPPFASLFSATALLASSLIFDSRPARASLDCFRFRDLLTCVAINARFGAAQFSWKADSSSAWGGWGTMGGRLSSTTSCVPGPEGFDCFGRGDNGHLFIKSFRPPSGPTAFTPPGGVWTDLGAPPNASSGDARGQINGNPSCTRIGGLLTCFMNSSSDGHFAQFIQSGGMGSWRWLGQPRFVVSPSCFTRSVSTGAGRQIVCIGETSDDISHRTFSQTGTETSDWIPISRRSLGMLDRTPAAVSQTRCVTSRSGEFACLTPRTGLILFESSETIRARVQPTPGGYQECVYTGSNALSCLTSGGAGYTLTADRTWTPTTPTGAIAEIRKCVASIDASSAECIGANFSRRIPPGRPRAGDFTTETMSNIQYTMGTWSLSPAGVPGGDRFSLCNPANLVSVPRRLSC